jgi:hypothetical protein
MLHVDNVNEEFFNNISVRFSKTRKFERNIAFISINAISELGTVHFGIITQWFSAVL